jgi:hypothetical protein
MTIIPTGANDTGRVIATLVTAATALFLLCGQLPAPYNRWARNAAIGVYGATFLGVLVYVGLWLLRVEF